VKLKLLDGVLV